MQLTFSPGILLLQDTASDTTSTALAQPPAPAEGLNYPLLVEVATLLLGSIALALVLRRLGQLAAAVASLKKELPGLVKGEVSKMKPAPESKDKGGKSEPPVTKQIETLLLDRFNRLYQELGQDHEELLAAITKMEPRPAAASAASASAGSSTYEPVERNDGRGFTKASSPEEQFLWDLVRDYNQSGDGDFNDKYNANTAQLCEKGSSQLSRHPAGSFSLVQAPAGGRWYGFPRRRSITPNMHDAVGFQQLFRYTGFDNKRTECGFYLEKPAVLAANTASGWLLTEPGRLRLNTEGN